MLQILASAPAATPSIASDTALLDWAGPLDQAHVLVIGSGALEVICALIRSGCAAAAEAGPADRRVAEPADVVLVPRFDAGNAAQVLALAHRALVPGGRCVLAAPSELVAHQAARLLRTQGFSAIRTRVLAGTTLVCAERPWFGPLVQSRMAAQG